MSKLMDSWDLNKTPTTTCALQAKARQHAWASSPPPQPNTQPHSLSLSRRDSRSLRLRLAALSPQGSASGLRPILHLTLRLRLRRLRRTHSALIPRTNLPQRLPSFYSRCAQKAEGSVGNELLHAPMKKPDWAQPVGSVSQTRTSVSQLY